MEVMPFGQDAGGHTSSLLTSLNLQRERAQFCDCVVRQKQSPGQLYPAHRCVLAASSPVLESVLSRTGALVDLQAPCLSGPVLALLLDYIYTGALPCTCTQQQYYSLLSAACYLQMDKLQEALCAWQQTEVNNAGKANILTENESWPCETMTSSHSETADTFNQYLPVTCSVNACGKREGGDACSLQTTAGSLVGNPVAAHADPQTRATGIDPCIKGAKADARGAHSTADANCCSGEDAHAFNGFTTRSTSESSGNANNCRRVSDSTLQNISNTTEGYSVSGARKEPREDRFHPAGIIKPWQNNTDEEMEGTDEGTRSSSLPSSSSPRPCCGAVPVIRHSGRSSMLQQVSPGPAYLTQASVDLSLAAASLPSSVEGERIIENATSKHKERAELEGLGHRNVKGRTRAEDLDSKDASDQSASQNLFCKCGRLQSGTIIKESTLSNTDHFVKLNDDVSKSAVAEECLDDVSLPVEASEVGSDSHYKDLCPKREAKENHSYSGWCPTEMQTHNSCCNLDGPEEHWCYRLQRAEARAKHVPSSLCDYDSGSKHMVTEDKGRSEGVCPPLSNTAESVLGKVTGGDLQCGASLVLEQISDTEAPEPCCTFAIPVDGNMSGPAGQSYRGHVRYHCIPQEHASHGDSGHKRSHPSHYRHSDQSSEDDESFVNPAHSPLRHHFAMGSTDRLLLLDISTKHAELLVSYEHRSDREKRELALDTNSSSGTEIRNNDEATSVAGVDVGEVGAGTKPGPECFDEFGGKSWFRETNVEERKSVGREQRWSRTEVKNKASEHEEGENQTSTRRVCSAPRVPESIQTSMSSTLSICIPSTLPASLPTNISAHLSTPVHHAFQCSLCDRSFSQRGSLNRHVRSHLGVRPFPCPRCPMTFSRQYRVTEHMRVHQRCTLGSEFLHPPASSI